MSLDSKPSLLTRRARVTLLVVCVFVVLAPFAETPESGLLSAEARIDDNAPRELRTFLLTLSADETFRSEVHHPETGLLPTPYIQNFVVRALGKAALLKLLGFTHNEGNKFTCEWIPTAVNEAFLRSGLSERGYRLSPYAFKLMVGVHNIAVLETPSGLAFGLDYHQLLDADHPLIIPFEHGESGFSPRLSSRQ